MYWRSLIPVSALATLLSCTQSADRIETVQPTQTKPAPAQAVLSQPAAIRPLIPSPAVPQENTATGSARVVVLGDSQISFGAGAAYTSFFSDLAATCADVPTRFQNASAAAIGVRSTSLHHWTTTDESARRPLCAVDTTYGVNAGAYGVTSPGRTYVQIGQDPAYPFCPPNRPALPAAAQALSADLLVLAFLGNAKERWQDAATARADWANAERQIPAGTACIAMTTQPSFEPATNAARAQAQTNLARAVQRSGRCAFVPGITARTRAAFEGNKDHFRTDATGRVTDPNHPTERSATAFTTLITPALCAAVAQALTD